MINKEKLRKILQKKVLDSSLLAKWLPRPNIGNRERKAQSRVVRNFLGLTPKEYRKTLVELSNTVEQLMCAKEWSKIEYSKLPSKAMSDYMKAFSKNDLARFQAYLTSLEKGETKINAAALFPYDVTKNMTHGNSRGADAQWNALPNYMENNNERVLPVVDVSGSMGDPAGQNATVTCLDVAISLGLYISERNAGIFKDAFVTFSNHPTLQILNGTLSERYNQLARAQWDMNTNLEAVFQLILSKAKKSNVPENEMPTMIMILSDMQFDVATRSGWGSTSTWNPNAQQMIEKEYADAGYTTPKIVYWNLNSRNTDTPVHFDKVGTALVSGFSGSLLKNLLGGKDLTPLSMMFEVVNSERYEAIKI